MQCFLKWQSISQLFIFSAVYKIDDYQESTNSSSPSTGAELLWVVQLDSMPGYKYLNIDSGVTLIGSADRTPDRKTILKKNSTKKRWRRRKFEPMIDYKYPTVVSGATPIGKAGRAPDEELLREDNEWRTRKKIFESIIGGKHQINKLDIYSHRQSGLCTRQK
jgi:hypothetical protein